MKQKLSRDASPRCALSDPKQRVSRAGRRADREPLQPDADLAKWCAALAESTAPVDVVPPGWFSVRGLAAKLKTPVPTLQGKIKQLLATGKAERKNFRVQLEKNVRPVPHYKLK